MPEIGEVARVVAHLRRHLVGKTVSKVSAPDDTRLYKDTTAAEFAKHMTGNKVADVKQWGKYFWLVMSSSPHPLMHFGMTGWLHIKNAPQASYQSMKSGADESTLWPPKFTKLSFSVQDSDNEFAFADARRLGKIRLVSSPDGLNLRDLPPLKANGPDPYQSPLTAEYLFPLLRRKSSPIKSFLLEQAHIAGIGNWVADEILYHARLFPETSTSSLTEEQKQKLLESITNVVKIAVETEAEQSLFPKDWLMLHRWGKGKGKEGGVARLPSGEKIEFITVGGRTSAYVPSLQGRGNGVVAAAEEDEEGKRPNGKGKKAKKSASDEEVEEEAESKPKPTAKGKKAKKQETQSDEEAEDVLKATASRKKKTTQTVTEKKAVTKEVIVEAKKPMKKTEIVKASETAAKVEVAEDEEVPLMEEKKPAKRGRKPKSAADGEDAQQPPQKKVKPVSDVPPPTLRRGRSAMKSGGV